MGYVIPADYPCDSLEHVPFQSIYNNFIFNGGDISSLGRLPENPDCKTLRNENDWELNYCNDGSMSISIPQDNYIFVASKTLEEKTYYNYSYNLFDTSNNQSSMVATIAYSCGREFTVFGEDADAMLAISGAYYESADSFDLFFRRDGFIKSSEVPIFDFTPADFNPDLNSIYGEYYQDNF